MFDSIYIFMYFIYKHRVTARPNRFLSIVSSVLLCQNNWFYLHFTVIFFFFFLWIGLQKANMTIPIAIARRHHESNEIFDQMCFDARIKGIVWQFETW